MIRDADVLLLDEPTAGLDVESWWRILEPLRRRASIIVAHYLLTVVHHQRAIPSTGNVLATAPSSVRPSLA